MNKFVLVLATIQLTCLETEGKNGGVLLSNVSAFNDQVRNLDETCFELMKIITSK